jgi:hypothetical protein
MCRFTDYRLYSRTAPKSFGCCRDDLDIHDLYEDIKEVVDTAHRAGVKDEATIEAITNSPESKGFCIDSLELPTSGSPVATTIRPQALSPKRSIHRMSTNNPPYPRSTR